MNPLIILAVLLVLISMAGIAKKNRELFYKKDMGILARNGFDFELSKRVLDMKTAEFNKLFKII